MSCPPMKMEQTECFGMLAYKMQTPGNYPEESIQHTVSCVTRAEVDCVDSNAVDR